DARASLQRRFTTNTVPTLPTLSQLSPIGQQRLQAAENTELTSATFHKVQLLEKKKLEYEYMKEQRRRFEAEMELFDLQFRSKESEITGLSQEFKGHFGHQSEPTTPPEYRGDQGSGFPSAFSRPSRYSITSPPSSHTSGTTARASRSGSMVAPATPSGGHPSKSVPGSRRGSDHESSPYAYNAGTMNARGSANVNRNSMPVMTGLAGFDYRQRSKTDLPDASGVLGHINVDDYNLDDEAVPYKDTTSKFPMLGKDNKLQFKDTTDIERDANGWPAMFSTGRHHRAGQQSLPVNNFRPSDMDAFAGAEVPKRANNRHSMEVYGEVQRPGLFSTPPSNGTAPKLQASLSTNDIPTMKSTNGLNGHVNGNGGGINSHAETHLHNHNANMGRIPASAKNRHSRDVSFTDSKAEEQPAFRQSVLHGSAAPFGPALSTGNSVLPTTNTQPEALHATSVGTPHRGSPMSGIGHYAAPAPQQSYYGGYGMAMNGMNTGMNGMNGTMNGMNGTMNGMNGSINGINGINAGMNGMTLNGQAPYNPAQAQQLYGPAYVMPSYQQQQYSSPRRLPFTDSQARIIQQRKQQNHDENLRLNQAHNIDEMLPHDIVRLCKDQYGCRYLQKQIETKNVHHIQKIFDATQDHVVDLMQDPFANYLCQKLLEHTNEAQRTVLIQKAAPNMVTIALNQHGTRALQKMIEFVSSPAQVDAIRLALENDVVALIQDLNGNHVIQKCLNKLKSWESGFIFDNVAANVVIVGTHRHGCCVLQRCIDHADQIQKDKLVHAITQNAFALVQDPFGNYVVQYILDINMEKYSKPLCKSFRGSVASLSKQKFSSNVIEKCIRISDDESKQNLIHELLQPAELDKLVRDNYANYVVQTAIDHADPSTKVSLIEGIRPMLTSIRQTPYGRRIIGKVQDFDNRV
ncbi:ARM repeat-containing protein, partial [Saccharata proteae CBS 121410]